MTTRTSTLMKLFVLCALLWVQALQVDHVTKQSVDSQHTDCLVCKNVSDSAPGGGTFALLHSDNYSDNLTNIYAAQPLQSEIFRAHPARAPPTTS